MNVIKSIGEYLDLVKNGIKNGDKIIESIAVSAQVKEMERLQSQGVSIEHLNISAETVAEIMRRKDICKICPYNSQNAAKERNYTSSIPFVHCTLCKCRIGYEDSKEYCLSCQCGIAEWNKRNPDLPQMEVKWGPITNNKTENNE